MSADLQPRLDKARQFLLSNRFSEALPLYQRLLQQRPSDAILWFEYGNAASGLHQRDLADRAWTRALELAPVNSELTGLIGHQYQSLRQPDRARACFSKAAAADPQGINPRISLAVLAEQNHCLEEARSAVGECLKIDPRDEQARYFKAVLDRRENTLEEAERELRDLLGSEPKHPFVRYAARYELANILDRTERYNEAMDSLIEAKSIVRTLTDTQVLMKAYDQAAASARAFTKNLPKTILRTWAISFPEQVREPKVSLAFLGGHPRSGTTLIEQVLDAHPAVAALDEPPAFLKLLQPEFHRSKALSAERLNALRRLYLKALSVELGPAAVDKVWVDKNPSPTGRLPLWLRVFPELRVLIALRDPRDVLLSCYFQNIPLNTTNVNFLSLERLAKHYADLMDIWLIVREWEGFAWIEIRYEDVIADVEKEGSKVTGFLGLSWHGQQVKFHEKSKRKQLYSPTYQDVTQPVYSRSVGRWRAYAKYLEPVQHALEPYRLAFGYD
jgi:tetratricopeptide (TPR) repeat protein